MFRRTRECCSFICSDPWGCLELVKLVSGVLVCFLLGAVYYSLLALFEKATGKDYLLRGTEQSVQDKAPEDRQEEV